MAAQAITTDEIIAGDSNQASVTKKMEADDGSVSEIADHLGKISFLDCSFCNKECSGETKSQVWKGKLENPKYKDKYPLPAEFIIGTGKKRTINLQKVLENLPNVIEYIRKPSTPYKELARLFNAEEKDKNVVTGPYIDEIKKFPHKQEIINSSSIHFIDCEYMLKVSIPKQKTYFAFLKGKMFKPNDHKIIDEGKKGENVRWIFIPSSGRFDEDVKLNRSNFKTEGELSAGDTICFVVVRENQFNRYREHFGDKLPIIQLPENVIGVGYARFWIVKIAKRFKLEYIWMIDDRIHSFKEYFPIEKENTYEMDPDAKDRNKNNRCQEYCFHKMESIMEKQPNLVAMSPRKYRPDLNVTYEFSYRPVQSVILLNITKLTEKNLNFRPELHYMEDMIFSKECVYAGLEVCTWNAIICVDKRCKKTDAKTKSQSQRGNAQT